MLSSFLRKSGLNKPLKFASKAAPIALGASLIPGVGGFLGGGLSKIGLGGVASTLGNLGKSGIGKGIASVGKFALNNADGILGGLSAYEGYKKGRESDKMLSRALNDPSLRPERPDYSDVFSGYSNAYTPQRLPSVGARASVLPPQIEELAQAPPRMPAPIPSIGGGGRRRKPMLEEAY